MPVTTSQQIHYNHRFCFTGHNMPLRNVKPELYQQQLDQKVESVTALFADFNAPEAVVYPSEPLHYRMRAEFKVWHQGDDSYFVMFRPDQPKQPFRIDSFPVGSTRINALMPAILKAIKNTDVLRHKLFQCEFLTTQTNEALVTLIYHKKLDEHWQAEAETLEKQLGIHIIGRSRKQKLVLSHDYVTEKLHVDGRDFRYQQVESGFTQPNAGINEKMLQWALSQSKESNGDLVELYCGNGNFTAVLAQNFDKVLATEISKTSVRSALYNFQLNGINNVQIARMSSDEFSSALMGEREFKRLADIDLDSYRFSTVLVDPPRAGLDDNTIELVKRFEKIIYISCNPKTLRDNLNSITKSHRISTFALFDQFPYTDHIECGMVLEKAK